MKYSFLPYQYLITMCCVLLLLLSFHVSYYPLLFTIRARQGFSFFGGACFHSELAEEEMKKEEFSGLLISSKTLLVVNRIAFMHCWRPSEDLAESISCKQSEAHTHRKWEKCILLYDCSTFSASMRCLRSFYPCIQSM